MPIVGIMGRAVACSMQHIQAYYSVPQTSDSTGLKVNWGALQASPLMCITDSLCDLDFTILFVSCQP